MPNTIRLDFTEDECEILVDALEADLDDCREAAKEAREDGDAQDAGTFAEVAERIEALLGRFRQMAA